MKRTHPISGKCFICGKHVKGATKIVLVKHLKKEHNLELSNETIYLRWYRLEQPKCPFCGNPRKFYSFTLGYAATCCDYSCSNQQHIQTNIKKYGVSSTNAIPEVIAKKQETYLAKTGFKSPFQRGSPGKERAKETSLKKYGVESPMKSEEVKSRVKKTNQERYGVDYAAQNPEIYQKVVNTNLERYGVKTTLLTPSVQEKSLAHSIETYGTANPLSSPIIKIKSRLSCLVKYGVEYPSQAQSVKDKIMRTNLERYGVEHTFNRPDIRQLTDEGFKSFVKEQRGIVSTQIDFNDRKEYSHAVKRYTRYSVRLYNKLIWELSYNEVKVETVNMFATKPLWKRIQLDHKYSQFRGWADGIHPRIIGSVFNLTYLTAFDNDSKDAKCSITLQGLKSLRTRMKKKYPDLFKNTDEWGYPNDT